MSEQLASRTDRVSIGELLDGLGRASLGLGLMVPSLLAMIPLPGPFGVLFGTMIGAIAVQVMMGETRLRLPRFLAGRTVPPAAVGTALRRFATPLQWAERLSTPRRLLPLTGRVARVVLAAPLLIMAMTLALPIPLGNGLPAIAVIVFALGFMERDGLATRSVEATVPVSVTYAVTPLGATLVQALQPVIDWAETKMPEVGLAQAAYDRRD